MDFDQWESLSRKEEGEFTQEEALSLVEEVERLRKVLSTIYCTYRHDSGLSIHHQAYCMRSEAKLALYGSYSEREQFLYEISMMRVQNLLEELGME